MNSKLALYGGPKALSHDIPAAWPPISADNERAVIDSLRGGRHSYGPNCEAFEREFAEWNRSRFAINTNSGTAALHMCVAAVGCNAGDEVIVPAYSWSSSATAVLHHNCIPVFVDIDWKTMNIDPALIKAAITSKTRAVVVVHLHGLSANMQAICNVAKDHQLYVIEDACQAHGATFSGVRVGNLGHCAAFSFNQNKTISAGEAGMFVTNDERLFKNAQQLWSFGETKSPSSNRDYHAYALGWMYRSNDLTAAFGRSQLKLADSYISTQRENARMFTRLLQGNPFLFLPIEPESCEHAYSTYTIRVNMTRLRWDGNPSWLRDKIVEAIRAEGVPNGLVVWQRFILPEMTVFRAKNAYGHGCPWSCVHARSPSSHSQQEFPVALRHCDCSFGINTPLRQRPGSAVCEGLASVISKVMNNWEELTAERHT